MILQIVPALDTGGAERTTIDIARALADMRWTALVATGKGAVEWKERASEKRSK